MPTPGGGHDTVLKCDLIRHSGPIHVEAFRVRSMTTTSRMRPAIRTGDSDAHTPLPPRHSVRDGPRRCDFGVRVHGCLIRLAPRAGAGTSEAAALQVLEDGQDRRPYREAMRVLGVLLSRRPSGVLPDPNTVRGHESTLACLWSAPGTPEADLQSVLLRSSLLPRDRQAIRTCLFERKRPHGCPCGRIQRLARADRITCSGRR